MLKNSAIQTIFQCQFTLYVSLSVEKIEYVNFNNVIKLTLIV